MQITAIDMPKNKKQCSKRNDTFSDSTFIRGKAFVLLGFFRRDYFLGFGQWDFAEAKKSIGPDAIKHQNAKSHQILSHTVSLCGQGWIG